MEVEYAASDLSDFEMIDFNSLSAPSKHLPLSEKISSHNPRRDTKRSSDAMCYVLV